MSLTIKSSRVRVKVPATSANIGPGFSSLALAHSLYNQYEVVPVARAGSLVYAAGKDAEKQSSGEENLVVQSIRQALEHFGAPQCGLELHAALQISPQSGLGQRTASILAGLILARGLVGIDEQIQDEDIIKLALSLGAAPLNLLAAFHGGIGIGLPTSGGDEITTYAWSPLPISTGMKTTVLVPRKKYQGLDARQISQISLSFTHARLNASCAGALILGLMGQKKILPQIATQLPVSPQLFTYLPYSAQMLSALRQAGWAAFLSGTGPALLVFEQLDSLTKTIATKHGWQIYNLELSGPAFTEIL